jgi:hypothetical protein
MMAHAKIPRLDDRHAKITNDITVYDPTCGSGSLLLKIGDEAHHGHQNVKVTLYGQEKDNATAGLARMNMILHDYATAAECMVAGRESDFVAVPAPSRCSSTSWRTASRARSTPTWRSWPRAPPPGHDRKGAAPVNAGALAFGLHLNFQFSRSIKSARPQLSIFSALHTSGIRTLPANSSVTTVILDWY